jgi:hypothetical protein
MQDQHVTHGETLHQAIYQQMIDAGMKFAIETPLPTVRFENLAPWAGQAMPPVSWGGVAGWMRPGRRCDSRHPGWW